MEDEEDFLAAVEADNAGTPEPEVLELTEPAGEGETKAPKPAEEKPAETPAEPTPEPTPEPPRPEPEKAPIAALLDERDRRKAAEARLAQIQSQQPQFQMPDPYEDPEGFAAVQEAKVGQALYQTNLRWSEAFNSVKHGEETVQKAKEWGFKKCDEDPYFNARVAASPDPLGLVVSEYRREEIASKVTPDEFEQFQAWKAAQSQLRQQPAASAAPATQTSIPPPSIASAPSAGTILTEPEQTDEEVFNEVIGKR